MEITKCHNGELAELLTLTVEVSDHGAICYYNQQGLLHRVHGPAVIWECGDALWAQNGQRHREDGPAYEGADGTRYWYLNGMPISEEQHMNESNLSDAALAELLTLTMEADSHGNIRYRNHLGQLHRVHGPAIICDDGSKEWYLDGNRHRTDGPAVIRRDGDELWYLNGRYHRTDGPAVKSANGDETWYVNGRPHRIDGPAISWIGSKSWYLHGDYLTEEEWNERIQSL